MATVAIAVINYNGGPALARCLRSVHAQTVSDVEVALYDNASTDGSLEMVAAVRPRLRVVALPVNRGYAGAANLAIRQTTAPFVLVLNPDVILTASFLEAFLAAADGQPRVGSFSGKLLRLSDGEKNVIDSTGHLILRSRWALNRGEGEIDHGQYDQPGEVFGVSGAAALYRRAMLEDVKVGTEYFDETFFVYLEDVDLDWRARLRGWKAYYVPTAVAYHERGHKGRPAMRNPFVLRHSLKNRYLMMLKNDRATDLVRDLPAILGMEVLRLVDYLLTHPRALRGYLDVLALVPHLLAERKEIQRRRTASSKDLRRWFDASSSGRLRQKFLDRIRGST